MSAAEFQKMLDGFGRNLAAKTGEVFQRKYPSDWPDEESVTSGLLATLETFMSAELDYQLDQKRRKFDLRAKLTRKKDEKKNGADALIRFRCGEPEWKIDTIILVQAKRQEPRRGFDGDNHKRLIDQIDKMLRYSAEAFVMIYSKSQGVTFLPAVVAKSLGSNDLFEASPIDLSGFVSGILRGRFGDPIIGRLPGAGMDWDPTFELVIELVAHAERQREMAAEF